MGGKTFKKRFLFRTARLQFANVLCNKGIWFLTVDTTKTETTLA